MPTALFILFFLLLTSVLTFLGYKHYAKPASILDQLATTSQTTDLETPEGFEASAATGMAKVLESIGHLLPYSPRDVNVMKQELTAAGFRSSYAAYAYLGTKVLGCLVLVSIGLLLRSYTSNSVSRMMIPVSSAIAGFLLPGFILGRLVKRRQLAVRLALPDVLDLLVISTEAGCALDKALLNVSREFRTFHPIISEELTLVNMEMLAGGSRIDALRNFATRTGEEELKKLVAILVQTDRFGTSIADALRTQSEHLRIRRRQIAEEKAGKVGVKLVFPIFFFCMPALMIVVAGPGMLQLFRNLSSAVAGIK